MTDALGEFYLCEQRRVLHSSRPRAPLMLSTSLSVLMTFQFQKFFILLLVRGW